MGMFNTVKFFCPELTCGEEQEYQSKVGSCEMKTFWLADAPLLDLADLIDESQNGRICCKACGVKIQIIIQKIVEIRIKPLGNGED